MSVAQEGWLPRECGAAQSSVQCVPGPLGSRHELKSRGCRVTTEVYCPAPMPTLVCTLPIRLHALGDAIPPQHARHWTGEPRLRQGEAQGRLSVTGQGLDSSYLDLAGSCRDRARGPATNNVPSSGAATPASRPASPWPAGRARRPHPPNNPPRPSPDLLSLSHTAPAPLLHPASPPPLPANHLPLPPFNQCDHLPPTTLRSAKPLPRRAAPPRPRPRHWHGGRSRSLRASLPRPTLTRPTRARVRQGWGRCWGRRRRRTSRW